MTWKIEPVGDACRLTVTHDQLAGDAPPELYGGWPMVLSGLKTWLETGRTHQIRVHMAALRHPCVGDLTYGADPTLAARLGLKRQWLHAKELGFVHPGTGDPVRFESPYPEDLAEALRILRSW